VKRIFVCSPYAGNTLENIKRAKRYCKYVLACGHAPIAPHLFFPLFLDDTSPTERSMGLNAGLAWLEVCQELWVFDSKPSPGMTMEIAFAEAHRIPVCEKWQELEGLDKAKFI
jgi:hypothetical protein